MTVSSTTVRATYAGNGVSVAFSAPMYFLASADLVVILVEDDVETTQMETTHYTVSGAGNPAGGTVTFLVAPTAGQTVVILRDPSIVQEVDYVEAEKFPAETHERALDRLTMIAQRARDLIGRALYLGEADVDGSGAFRAGGNRITDLGAPSVGSDAIRKSDLDAAITATGVTPLPYLELAEIASPANPALNNIRVFAKDVSGATRLFVRDGAGTESNLHPTTPTFLSLPDTPGDYTGDAGKLVAVNSGQTAVEFVAPATTTEYRANAPDKILKTSVVWAAANPITPAFSAVMTLDFGDGLDFKITATSNFTLNFPSRVKAGQKGIIKITHSGAPRTMTLATGVGWRTPGSQQITLGINIDVLSYWAETDTLVHLIPAVIGMGDL